MRLSPETRACSAGGSPQGEQPCSLGLTCVGQSSVSTSKGLKMPLQRDPFRMTQETLPRMILKTLPIKVMNHFCK